MDIIKILYLVPHLSTGGMPQFVSKRIESLQKFKDQVEIFLVEYSQFSDTYVVQRNQIITLLGMDHFYTLGETTQTDKKYDLIKIIQQNEIDIVHVEEISEGFESFNKIPLNLLNQLYDNKRSWKIIETCHNVWYNPENKKLHPDAYSFVTPYHFETFKSEKSYKKLHTYPYENKVKTILEELDIPLTEHRVPLLKKLTEREKLEIDPNKIHILNVGLWTEGKNQKEGIEVARLLENSNPDLHFHFIGNQAENFKTYWEPIMDDLPKNVTIWGERNDVDSFMIACDVMMFNSVWECNPLVVREAINYGIKIITRNLPHYMGMFDNYITPIETNDYLNISNQLLKLISSDKTYEIEEQKDFGKDLLSFYDEVLKIEKYNNNPIENDYVIKQHFVVNPFFEILGQGDREFNIKLFDEKSLVYENNIKINSWVKLNREYYTKWKTEIRENNNLIYENVLDLENKRVYISFGSKSLGDTMAWIPYCEVFRKKHGCQLIVSTFLNSLFKDQYPEIEFVEPGEVVPNIHAQYRLGWHYTSEGVYDKNKHPFDFKKMPLQKTATDILGLDYEEVRPLLKLPNTPKNNKKVGIGFHSTSQAKYWNNKNGWQEVVDYLNNLGYECMIYSKENDGYMNNFYPKGVSVFKGGNLQEVINDLSTCEFFIGLGSGLSWLAWACKLPVVLISGFSEKWAETKLDTYRVINESVCHGCFNWDRLDAGDWNWCPLHKGTDRQFECSKQITSEMVIKEINKIRNNITSFNWGNQSEWYKETITSEIFEDRIYEKFFEVNEGDIVLDFGSSIGPFTYSILEKKPKHVFCIEPCEDSIPTLVKNTIGHPVTYIIKGLSSSNGVEKSNTIFNSVGQNQTDMETITFKKLLDLYGIDKIDFLKTDCEGGEYHIFNDDNFEFIKNNVKKIVGEWHLNPKYDKEVKNKFRQFRDLYLKEFTNYNVFSVDGIDIKWDLWNEHFIDYYNEVIIYIDNRIL